MTGYGLIGRTLGHSFSASYFNSFFKERNIDAEYNLFELREISDLPQLLYSHPHLRGLNVTIPYKQEVIPFLSGLTPEAESIGAVNTVLRTASGDLLGHNTDAPGFSKALLPHLADRRQALVLGTGGASRAVVYALRQLGVEPTLVSRRKTPDTITYGELTPDVIRTHPLIVNCTPLGTWPETDRFPPIPYNLLTSSHFCFDLVYNPPLTQFMKLSIEAGAGTCNGLEMLHYQADFAWIYWNSQK
ncbi:MAG: shikimate dehydrogenase [Bacteroides sp.]|nr:shikimate dehydrogenase [Bacteroides sp.]